MLAEHRVIENVIRTLPDALAALDQRRRLDVQKLRGVVEFLRSYADYRHHQREEGIFFPFLVSRGVPAQGCPIGGLNNEHEKGRALVSALDKALSSYEQQHPESVGILQQTLKDIVALYQRHLWMEDAMVFPMAEKLVSESDNRELLEQFGALDRTIGPEVVTQWEQFATSLSFQAGAVIAG